MKQKGKRPCRKLEYCPMYVACPPCNTTETVGDTSQTSDVVHQDMVSVTRMVLGALIALTIA